MVGLGGELAVEAEESLLVWREGADVDFVLLVGVHLEVDFEDREDQSRDLGELNL